MVCIFEDVFKRCGCPETQEYYSTWLLYIPILSYDIHSCSIFFTFNLKLRNYLFCRS